MKMHYPSRLASLLGILSIFVTACASMSESRQAQIEASPHYQDGHFQNPVKRRPIPLLKSLGVLVSGNPHAQPEGQIPTVKKSRGDYVSSPKSGLRITWLGHATVLVEMEGQRILFDPVWSERVSPVSWAGPARFFAPPLPLEELPPVDLVVISHNHYDHLDRQTIERLETLPAESGRARVGRYLVPLGVGQHLEDWGVDPARVQDLDWWQESQSGSVKFTATPARHGSGRSATLTDRLKTLWCGWSLRGEKHSLFFSGDTSFFPGFEEIGRRLGPFDVTLMETGAYHSLWSDVHIGPEQAVRAHQLLGGGLYIPIHWGTFKLGVHGWTEPAERLIEAASLSGVSFAIPRPGQFVEPSQPPAFDRWWPNIPWQSARDTPVISSGEGSSKM